MKMTVSWIKDGRPWSVELDGSYRLGIAGPAAMVMRDTADATQPLTEMIIWGADWVRLETVAEVTP